MAETLPICRKTLKNQSINQSKGKLKYHMYVYFTHIQMRDCHVRVA